MATELLKISRVRSVNVVDVIIPEEIDATEFDVWNERLPSMLGDQPQTWVLNLKKVQYMGSAGLGLLVNIRQQVKSAGGRLVVCGLSPELKKIFRTCCLEKLFVITRSLDDAIESVG